MIICCDTVTTIPSNPFATRFVRPGSLHYRFSADSTPEDDHAMLLDIAERLNQHRCGLLVGPHGSGKTTLLHSLLPPLRQSFPEIAHVQLGSCQVADIGQGQTEVAARRHSRWNAARHAWRLSRRLRRAQASLATGGLLVIDGAEQLNMIDLTRVRRSAHRHRLCILATSHQPLAGMAVLHETQVRRNLVESLVDELLSAAPQTWKHLVASELQRRDWDSLSDVRALWFELYDLIHPQLCLTIPSVADRER